MSLILPSTRLSLSFLLTPILSHVLRYSPRELLAAIFRLHHRHMALPIRQRLLLVSTNNMTRTDLVLYPAAPSHPSPCLFCSTGPSSLRDVNNIQVTNAGGLEKHAVVGWELGECEDFSGTKEREERSEMLIKEERWRLRRTLIYIYR